MKKQCICAEHVDLLLFPKQYSTQCIYIALGIINDLEVIGSTMEDVHRPYANIYHFIRDLIIHGPDHFGIGVNYRTNSLCLLSVVNSLKIFLTVRYNGRKWEWMLSASRSGDMIKQYNEWLTLKNDNKRHVAINLPQNTLHSCKHPHSIVLATF